jgi:hypothetical protein
MSELTDFQKAIILECTCLIPYSRIVYDGSSYYLDMPRHGKRINLDVEVLQGLVAEGYGEFTKHNGFILDSSKSDEIYEQGVVHKKIPNTEHPGKFFDVVEILYKID